MQAASAAARVWVLWRARHAAHGTVCGADGRWRFEARASPGFELELLVKAMLILVRAFRLCSARPRRAAPSALRTADGRFEEGWACKPSPSNPTSQGARAPCSLRQTKKAPMGPCLFGGEGGIRTHGTVTRTPDFESGTFDHSATSPGRAIILRSFRVRPHYRRPPVKTEDLFTQAAGTRRSSPAMYGRSTSGTTTLPSACW